MQYSLEVSSPVQKVHDKFAAFIQQQQIETTLSRYHINKRNIISSICSASKSSTTNIYANTRPHSYAQYLDRLKSFTPTRWFAKPCLISATTCLRVAKS